MKYLVFCLIGAAIILSACSAPTKNEEALEREIRSGCTPMKQSLEDKRAKLVTAAPADKERISSELVNEDLKFTQWCGK
jgi:hypothetical protein